MFWPYLSESAPLRDDADTSRLLLELNNALISQLDLEELLRSIFALVKQVFDQTIAAYKDSIAGDCGFVRAAD